MPGSVLTEAPLHKYPDGEEGSLWLVVESQPVTCRNEGSTEGPQAMSTAVTRHESAVDAEPSK